MNFFKHANIGKIAIIASLGALGACQTMSNAGQGDAPALSASAMNEKTGEGVYFPAVSSTETPEIRFGMIAGVGPKQRSMVVDQLNIAIATNGGSLPILVQAVGEERSTLVFTYMHADTTITPFIARGILARLTSISRLLPAVTEMGVSSEIDVYNLAAVLGFDRIIVTDGRAFAHQADLRQK